MIYPTASNSRGTVHGNGCTFLNGCMVDPSRLESLLNHLFGGKYEVQVMSPFLKDHTRPSNIIIDETKRVQNTRVASTFSGGNQNVLLKTRKDHEAHA